MYEEIEGRYLQQRAEAIHDEDLDKGPVENGQAADDEADDEDNFEEIHVSFACEDCDYRWEASFESEEDADEIQICPMCGTSNTTQI